MLTKEAIIGKRFGLLIVSEFLYKDAGRNVYSCQCDCGSIFTVSQSHLVEKKKFDCGCLSKLDRGTLKSQGRFNNTINFLEELKKKNQQRQELERNYGFELEKKQLRLLQLKKKFQYERSQRMGIVEIPIEIRIKGREERLKRKQLVRLDRQNKKKHRIERFNIKEQNKILVESKLNKFKKEFLNPMNVDKYLNDYSITVSELKKDSVAYQKYKFLMILKKEQMKLEGINSVKVKIKKKLPNPKYLKLMEIQDSLKIFNKSIYNSSFFRIFMRINLTMNDVHHDWYQNYRNFYEDFSSKFYEYSKVVPDSTIYVSKIDDSIEWSILNIELKSNYQVAVS